ncbi:hypothetical protein Taro_053950 [Colocasia esculenta]|uniref:Homeobox domain-containing protein n=1 Tax=Colocasia esculenta TaxID=4460 RepID=A0A843XML2_COLES|nr:hypothetical protein [Colocasia esculenta]
MWTMESLRGRKLRPLFRTLPSQTSLANSRVATAFSSCCVAHNQRAQRMEAALLPLRNQYYWTAARKSMDEKVRREGTRWNPTKEQLRALEELYARGTRTPPAHQIQLIAAQLRRYGRIEGKNVFYWFQNHKARERQRLRRQAEEEAAAGPAASDDRNKQDSGGAVPAAGSGVLKQESKSLAPDKSYSSTSPATSAAAGGIGERSWAEGGAAWQKTSPHQQSRLPLAAAAAAASSISSASSGHSNLYLNWACEALASESAAVEEKKPTTLELFPLRSENHHLLGSSSGRKPSISSHVQFFQFL